MKTRYLLLVLVICSCTNSIPSELAELKLIIRKDFSKDLIIKELIPLSLGIKHSFSSYTAETERTFWENPLPPPQVIFPIEKLEIGRNLFRQLINSNQIDSTTYVNLLAKIDNQYGNKQEPSLDCLTCKSLSNALSNEEVDSYRRFAQPIIIENILIVYTEHYSNIQSAKELGLIGSGTYLIYRREDSGWILINRIVKWIT